MEFPASHTHAKQEAKYCQSYYLSLKFLCHNPLDGRPCPLIGHTEGEETADKEEKGHAEHRHHIIYAGERRVGDRHLNVSICDRAEDNEEDGETTHRVDIAKTGGV